MSIFDTYASVLGSSNTSASRFATQALDLLRNYPGGLQGLLDKFRDHGFDDAARSWVGTGANLGITKEDLERVLGRANINNLAVQTGVPPDLTATELANLLPQLVDKLTPGGKLHEGEDMNKLFEALKGKLGMI
jgi:uncharacterized protein YidB (DUF937 family)